MMNSVPFKKNYSCTLCPVNQDCLCRPFDENEMNAVLSFKKEERQYKKNEIIFKNDSKLNEVMTIVSGWTIEYKLMPDGKRSIFNISIPGDFVGFHPEKDFLSISVLSAVTDVKVCVYDKESLENFVKKHPEMASRLIRMLSYEVNKLSNFLTSVSRLSSKFRLLYFIQSLGMRINKCSYLDLLGKSIDIPLTHEQIADCLGITNVHLSRTLKELKNNSILQTSKGSYKFKILNEADSQIVNS